MSKGHMGNGSPGMGETVLQLDNCTISDIIAHLIPNCMCLFSTLKARYGDIRTASLSDAVYYIFTVFPVIPRVQQENNQ